MDTPAGWYDDGSGRQRWWDGQQWTDQYADAQAGSAGTTVPLPTGITPGRDSAPLGATVAAPAKGLAIAALIVGVVAFLTGLVPVLGILLGVAGLALGIFALVKRQSKGLGLTGVILAGVAVLASTGMTIGMASMGAHVVSSASSVSDDPSPAVETKQPIATPPPSAPSAPTKSPKPAEQPKPAPRAGTPENPLPQPYTAKGILGGDKYTLTAKIFNASANEQIQEWNQFNSPPPAGFKYVVAEMTMTGIDKDGVEPALATLDLSLATAEGNKYDSEFVVLGDGMTPMQEGPKLYPGNAFTGYTVYVVPEAAAAFLLYDNGKYVSIS